MWRPLFSTDGAWGAIRGGAQVNVFGQAKDIGTVEVDIIDNAGADYYFSQTPARMKVVAADVADAPGGTGLRTVRLIGLKSWTEPEILEDVPVGSTSVNSFVALNWAGKPSRIDSGSAAGSLGKNKGLITIETDPGAVEAARILTGQNTTHMACFSWPLNWRFYLSGYYATILKKSDIRGDLYMWLNREPDRNLLAFYTYIPIGVSNEAPVEISFNPYAMIDGPCVLKFRVDPSATGADVSAGCYGYLSLFPDPRAGSEVPTARSRGDFF